MKKYLGVFILALWLSGCDGEKKISEGTYLIDDIRIVFDGASNKEDDPFKSAVSEGLKEIKDDIYFNFTSTQATYYTPKKRYTEELKGNRIQIENVWHTINIDEKNTIRLVSDRKSACSIYDCEITMILKKKDDQSPEVIRIKQNFEKWRIARETQLLEQKSMFNQVPMDDFPGILFSPEANFTIKLPFRMFDKISQRKSGMYIRRMGRLLIDKENEDTLIYTHQDQQTDFDLFTVSAEKSDFNLALWLEGQNEVLFQSDSGAAYYNRQGILEAVYFQYDESTHRYFVGLANTEEIVPLAKAFAVLRTMDKRYRGEQVLSMRDLALSQQALEEKYGIKIADEFDLADMHQILWEAIDDALAKPIRFMTQRMRRTAIAFPSGSRYEHDVLVSVSTKTRAELMAEVKAKIPEGKQIDEHVFVYGDMVSDGYEYYVDAKDGFTLHFTVTHDTGTPLERLMFVQVLRQLDLARFPTIPEQEKKNLFKYNRPEGSRDDTSERYFVVKEGLLDSTGNLIIPAPDDGYFNFSESEPYLLATKYKPWGEHTYRATYEGFIFDDKGKSLLYTPVFKGIIEQRFVIGGDENKLGLYDLKDHKWLLKPTYHELKWHDGVYIGSHVNIQESDSMSVTEKIKEDLLDKNARVIASGKDIRMIKNKDRIIVIGSDEKIVNLVNKQGKILFTRVGSDLEYVPEIDAYSVRELGSANVRKRIGIVSERGEVIFPVEYGGYLIQDGYLEMSSADFSRVSLFEVDKVKNWRNHQPLKEVVVSP
ncbi:hypothetical protein [Pectobacterium sp. B1J-3]|uniref:hypothetical protein n=1 Tax=Pectobacterium sp. B1J-3 TaxID=3385371 RepID=UPI0039069E90